jgi:hypothetical protein
MSPETCEECAWVEGSVMRVEILATRAAHRALIDDTTTRFHRASLALDHARKRRDDHRRIHAGTTQEVPA